MLKSIAVLCSSNEEDIKPGMIPIIKAFGKLLAERGITLVYNGERKGILGILVDKVLENKGEVSIVITRDFFTKGIKLSGRWNKQERLMVPAVMGNELSLSIGTDAMILISVDTKNIFGVKYWRQIVIKDINFGVLNLTARKGKLDNILLSYSRDYFGKQGHYIFSDKPEELLDQLGDNLKV
jgi:hypothetical protein